MFTPNEPNKVKGPASYFPSIETKYGRPIPEWKQIIRSSGLGMPPRRGRFPLVYPWMRGVRVREATGPPRFCGRGPSEGALGDGEESND